MRNLLLLFLFSTGQVFAWQSFEQKATGKCLFADTKIDHLRPLRLPYVLSDLDKDGESYLVKFSVAPSFSNEKEWIVAKEGQAYLLKGYELERDGRAEVPKNIVKKAISETTALIIIDIWLNEIRETRYSTCQLTGLDGEDYKFAVSHMGESLYGFTWSPSDDLPPKWMVESGYAILEFAKSPKADEQKLQAELKAQRDRLYKYLTGHGVAD